MPTTFLNLTDLDNIIRRFEKAYNVSSVDMLKDEATRAKISEDALLRWETYLEQRVRLRDLSEQTHRQYLSNLEEDHRASKSERLSHQQTAYAA
jgi:hypothetical protein